MSTDGVEWAAELGEVELAEAALYIPPSSIPGVTRLALHPTKAQIALGHHYDPLMLCVWAAASMVMPGYGMEMGLTSPRIASFVSVIASTAHAGPSGSHSHS